MNTTNAPARAAVLIADVVASSKIDDFIEFRDRRLAHCSRRHLEQGLVVTDYAVTAWDEFQVVADRSAAMPRLLFDLRLAFAPVGLAIGIGEGEVTGWPARRGSNLDLGGEAFVRARAALDDLKHAPPGDELGRKGLRRTRFELADRERSTALDLVYALHDAVIAETSEAEWAAMQAMAREGTGREAAAALGKDASTISRQLKSGGWWHMLETARVAEAWLSGHGPTGTR